MVGKVTSKRKKETDVNPAAEMTHGIENIVADGQSKIG